MQVNEPVNKAIDKVVDAAVSVNLEWELGLLIDEAAVSTRMPVMRPSTRPLQVPKCWPTRPSMWPLMQL